MVSLERTESFPDLHLLVFLIQRGHVSIAAISKFTSHGSQPQKTTEEETVFLLPFQWFSSCQFVCEAPVHKKARRGTLHKQTQQFNSSDSCFLIYMNCCTTSSVAFKELSLISLFGF